MTDSPEEVKQEEGFHLMWYACQCGHRERFWNSRDAVTPFCMGCPSCGEPSLEHTTWNKDEYAPDHKPHVGQGMWINMTEARAKECATNRMLYFDGTEYELQGEERETMIDSLAKDIYERFGVGTSPDFKRFEIVT